MLPSELPDAHAPRGRKRDLYHDPDVFKELDEDVFQVRSTSLFLGVRLVICRTVYHCTIGSETKKLRSPKIQKSLATACYFQ